MQVSFGSKHCYQLSQLPNRPTYLQPNLDKTAENLQEALKDSNKKSDMGLKDSNWDSKNAKLSLEVKDEKDAFVNKFMTTIVPTTHKVMVSSKK